MSGRRRRRRRRSDDAEQRLRGASRCRLHHGHRPRPTATTAVVRGGGTDRGRRVAGNTTPAHRQRPSPLPAVDRPPSRTGALQPVEVEIPRYERVRTGVAENRVESSDPLRPDPVKNRRTVTPETSAIPL